MILIFTFALIITLCFWATHEAIRDEQMMELADRAAKAPAVIYRDRMIEDRRLRELYDEAMRELFQWRHRSSEIRFEPYPPKIFASPRMPSFFIYVGDRSIEDTIEVRMCRLQLAVVSELPPDHLKEQMKYQLRDGILQHLTDITTFRLTSGPGRV